MSGQPFHGMRFFLHVRTTNNPCDKSKHDSKKIVQRLGGTLSLGLAECDMVVFHNGSRAVLENASALGKPVVTLNFLYACRAANAKVEVISQYVPDELRERDFPGRVLSELKSSESVGSEGNPGGDDNRPFLLDASDQLDPRGDARKDATQAEVVKHEAVASLVENTRTATEPAPTQTLLSRVEALLSRSEGVQADTSRGAAAGPIAPLRGADESPSSHTMPVWTEQPMDRTDAGKKSAAEPGYDTTATHSRGGSRKRQRPCSALPPPPSPPPTTETEPIQPPAKETFTPIRVKPTRITATGPEEEKAMICDIVEALGCEFEVKVFGRGAKKPSHYIILGDVMTPKVLLARITSAMMLTKQWIIDSLSFGDFVEPLPHHFHKLYLPPQLEDVTTTVPGNSEVEKLEAHRKLLSGDTARLRQASLLTQYTFYLQGCSENPSNEVYAELLKLMGASVTRTFTPNVSAVIELDGGVLRQSMSETERMRIATVPLINASWIVTTASYCAAVPFDAFRVEMHSVPHPPSPFLQGVAALAVGVLAKTKGGPVSSIKYAENQPTSQQLHSH